MNKKIYSMLLYVHVQRRFVIGVKNHRVTGLYASPLSGARLPQKRSRAYVLCAVLLQHISLHP